MDVDFPDFGYDLVDGGTASEDIGNQLQISNVAVFVFRAERLIFPISGKIKEPCRESFLVEPFHDKFCLFHCKSHISILSREYPSFT